MSSTTLAPQVPPTWRLKTVAVALLLIGLGLWLSAAVRDQFASHGAGPTLASTSLRSDRPLPTPVALLVIAGLTLSAVALLLALAQRSRNDLALAGAAMLWAVHFGLGGRAAAATEDLHGARMFGLQFVTVGAVALSLWYGLQLLRRTGLAPHPMSLARVLVVAAGLTLALNAGWNMPHPLEWVLPIACAFACFGALVRMVDMARRPGSLLRPSLAAWLLAIAVSLAAAASVRELWLHMLQPQWDDSHWLAWFTTRWAVLLVLACTLGLRLDQLARMMRQLGSSHGSWRRRLRDTQRTLHQTRERLTLRERGESQRQQRDRILRELHDELGNRLLAALALAQQGERGTRLRQLIDSGLIELRLACDALEPAPRPLAEAMQELKLQLEPLLREVGTGLHWTLDPRAATLVLTVPETLQLLRIVREAVGAALDRPAARQTTPASWCKLLLDVPDGETGRHLRLRISDETPDAEGLAEPVARLGSGWIKLQRQATALGAQFALDPRTAKNGWSLELVMPLGRTLIRQPAAACRRNSGAGQACRQA